MLCAKAIRDLVGRQSKLSGTRVWASSNYRSFHRIVPVRNFSNEAKAVQRILARSQFGGDNLVRICGVRLLHTSPRRLNDNDDSKKNDDDEKERMLSALKTAVGFFVVPLFLLYIFSGANNTR